MGKKESRMLVLLNHALTEEQKKDAQVNLGVVSFVEPSQDIRSIWSNIIPEGGLNNEYGKQLKKVIDWIQVNSMRDDYVLVQGEFGATYYVITYCIINGLIPIYATTRREAVEVIREDGSVEKKQVFRHVQFREYLDWNP